jgi:hypothetical protein
MTWLLYTCPPNKQASAARELRRRDIEPQILMAFPSTRVNRHAKAKRPNPQIRPKYLGSYIALDLTPDQEWLLSKPDYMPVRVTPIPQPMGRRPVLTPAGVRFWTEPQGGLFRDCDIPQIQEDGVVFDFRLGERVGCHTHGFQGVEAEVIAINGDMTRVRFKEKMFVLEADVPARNLVKVA